jgi:hypothetical protein
MCVSGIAVCTLILATGGAVSVVASDRWQVCAAALLAGAGLLTAAAQAGLLLALVALQFALVAWMLCAVSRHLLWASMVALSKNTSVPSGEDTDRGSSTTAMFTHVSRSLFALATTATVASVVGMAVLPLVLDDPERQQQSVDAAFVASAVLLSSMQLAVAVSNGRLSAIARAQVLFRRSLFSSNVNEDTIKAMDDLARRQHKLALVMLFVCASTLVFLTVAGAYIQSR